MNSKKSWSRSILCRLECRSSLQVAIATRQNEHRRRPGNRKSTLLSHRADGFLNKHSNLACQTKTQKYSIIMLSQFQATASNLSLLSHRLYKSGAFSRESHAEDLSECEQSAFSIDGKNWEMRIPVACLDSHAWRNIFLFWRQSIHRQRWRRLRRIFSSVSCGLAWSKLLTPGTPIVAS